MYLGKYIIILLTLFMTACGHFYPTGPSIIDPELQPYYDLYIEHKETYTGFGNSAKVNMRFNILPGQYIGRCWKYSNGYRLIEIDRLFWSTASEKDREVLIFHELGHCDLNRGHVENSIMRPYHLNGYIFSQNETLYLQELFDTLGLQKASSVITLGHTADDMDTRCDIIHIDD